MGDYLLSSVRSVRPIELVGSIVSGWLFSSCIEGCGDLCTLSGRGCDSSIILLRLHGRTCDAIQLRVSFLESQRTDASTAVQLRRAARQWQFIPLHKGMAGQTEYTPLSEEPATPLSTEVAAEEVSLDVVDAVPAAAAPDSQAVIKIRYVLADGLPWPAWAQPATSRSGLTFAPSLLASVTNGGAVLETFDYPLPQEEVTVDAFKSDMNERLEK